MRILLASAAALALTGSVALAQSAADQIVSDLQAQGYTRIEVTEGPTQVKVEAIQGGTKLEYVYDRATGAILKQEVEPVDADDDTRPGVEIRNGDDFVRGGGDDGPLHDVGDDHGGDDDDRFDDHGGDRDDDDDRSGRGGSDDDGRSGGDDDDDGGDRSGSGSSGSDDDSSGRSGGDDDDDDRSGSGSGGSDDDGDGRSGGDDDHDGSRHGGDDD